MWFDQTPIIALAPMADMTDSPFTRICRQVSGHDFVVFKEMLSAEALTRDNEKTLKMGEFNGEERPLVMQIMGGDPANLAEAAQMVVDKFHPDGIDINMGCPVPKIANRSDAGAALLKDCGRAGEAVRAIKKLNLGVPLSVKTRLGWSQHDEILEFAKRIEEAGADALTIHGRTRAEMYSGTADWETIGKVKQIIKIPLLANGDVHSSEDIKRCLEITGADGVMMGRAALGNPWIFSGQTPDLAERKKVILEHAKLHLEHYGPNSMVTFRKHLLYYFKSLPGAVKIRTALAHLKTFSELENVLEAIV
ncbi:MAG: hypothetical protein A3J93_03965 [Candidatus Magasanikbacteria bacterium RIFOXYC2_FULL_42_28]|uniref:tRNA-dihydrouridine synthase n=1 Tax=Candidatus Magasanikbacteria bacterium RIFOXYC2_FULL_42_28 TaxID=1798704 RepID=A0A1F6NUV5_9BACT|nr:MAG: hypothetical protein A3J93_03965 [Candidatus Magasanikbacteria bacterium RIFOXYC2_FULL_42_28]